MNTVLFCVCLLSLQTVSESNCTIKKVGTMLEFKAGDQLVARYLFDKSLPRPHFHPLFGPDGQSLTRAYPMQKGVSGETTDHPHHRACWVGHQDVHFEGDGKKLEANFWAEADLKRILGKQVCVTVEEPVQGKDQASVITRNQWRAGDAVILEETRKLHLFDRGPSAKLIVLELDFHAKQGNVTFGDEKDGFMSLRVADWMAEKSKNGGALENAEGIKGMQQAAGNSDKKGCWGLRSDWCDYSGPKDGKDVGITLMDDPKNKARSCWHARDYGLLTANPFGGKKSGFPDAKDRTDVVTIPKGEHLKLRYGVLIHTGNAKQGNVAEHFTFFRDQAK